MSTMEKSPKASGSSTARSRRRTLHELLAVVEPQRVRAAVDPDHRSEVARVLEAGPAASGRAIRVRRLVPELVLDLAPEDGPVDGDPVLLGADHGAGAPTLRSVASTGRSVDASAQRGRRSDSPSRATSGRPSGAPRRAVRSSAFATAGRRPRRRRAVAAYTNQCCSAVDDAERPGEFLGELRRAPARRSGRRRRHRSTITPGAIVGSCVAPGAAAQASATNATRMTAR